MKTRHFCTYFDHNYLPRGMVMLESLREHCPQAHVHVLCLSDECHRALEVLAYPHVSLIRLAELEAADPELAATRLTRSLVEYYFTITPCLPWYILTQWNCIDEITYLDADMIFFSSPEPIFDEAKDASVIITPHRFDSHLQNLVKYGIFNVSWITFRNSFEGKRCLAWYRGSCLEWCKDELNGERFADQKYLDYFPQLFKNVHIINNIGAGLAPWNLSDISFIWRHEGPYVAHLPVIFYHAHGFKKYFGRFFSSGLLNYKINLYSKDILSLFKNYISLITVAEKKSVIFLNKYNQHGIRNIIDTNFIKLLINIIYEYKNKTLVIA